MWIVARVAADVHDKRRIAVNPQRTGGNESALDAMRAALSQHLSHRKDRFAADFVIGRDRVDEKLDFLRRVESLQDREFGAAELQMLATGDPLAGGDGHAPGSYPTIVASTPLATRRQRWVRCTLRAWPRARPGANHRRPLTCSSSTAILRVGISCRFPGRPTSPTACCGRSISRRSI